MKRAAAQALEIGTSALAGVPHDVMQGGNPICLEDILYSAFDLVSKRGDRASTEGQQQATRK
jgi:hypothetical protein